MAADVEVMRRVRGDPHRVQRAVAAAAGARLTGLNHVEVGTGVAHAFRAGDEPLSLLAYGERRPYDVTFYPRSRKVSFRGLGVIGRLELCDYWDGEPPEA